MDNLFPEEDVIVLIDFSITTSVNIDGNKKIYHIGKEKGILKHTTFQNLSGYDFYSENGQIYFLSKIRDKYPTEGYNAVFYLEIPKGEKIDLKTIISCSKKEIYLNQPTTSQILSSWDDSFLYKHEKRGENGIIFQYGLRPPQTGALHSILAHWSISNKPALVVMPTGTGKTETMLCLSVANTCDKILLVVPSDSLRTQIANKFIKLGILKDPKFEIIKYKALNPRVTILKTGIKNTEQALEILDSNIIISTPQILSGLIKEGRLDILDLIIQQCNYLIVDEAHHVAAKTWNDIKSRFEVANKRILMFTATPFRNDGARIVGDIIYNYPLSLAQKDKYYENIIFEPIIEFNPLLADQKIAEKAVQILESDIKNGYDHILMARVDERKKAEEIFESIYSKYSDYNPVFIHSGISKADKKEILENIKNKKHRIIICVDMLGEGFDLPQLKICAMHDIHKNITTSFQFFGRFTRTSDIKLGKATLIANIVDTRFKGVLQKLYRKDSDWDRIISQSNENIISDIIEEESFFKNFSDIPIPDKIPLRNITPAMSTVVYRLYDPYITWTPEKHIKYFDSKKYETTIVEHQEKKLIVIISKTKSSVQWGKIDDLINIEYDLYIAYLNEEQKLLYINSSNNSSTHNKLAENLVGSNITLFNESDIYRSLSGIFQLELFNLGLKSHLNGPISFTMYSGNGIIKGLDELDKNTMHSSNLFGVGYENGEKISIGCSSKGRVWTKLVKTIPDYCDWCDKLGDKLLDESVNTSDILEVIQKPERIDEFPKDKKPITIKWNEGFYFDPLGYTINENSLIDYDISLISNTEKKIKFSISLEGRYSIYEFTLEKEKNGRGFKYIFIEGTPIIVNLRKEQKDILDIFLEYPPVIWFHENSKMYNDLLFSFNYNIPLFNLDKMIVYNWDGVNIQKESQKKEKRTDSIQYRIIQDLKGDKDYSIIFDDDDANEASDIIAIKSYTSEHNKLIISLYHCKYSSKAETGNRLEDLYEVCGQAQRSFHWRHNIISLMEHMIRRNNNRINNNEPSRFEVGGNEEIHTIMNMIMSKYCDIQFNIYIVQPGLKKEKLVAENGILKLLGATDLLLKKTGNELYIISS